MGFLVVVMIRWWDAWERIYQNINGEEVGHAEDLSKG